MDIERQHSKEIDTDNSRGRFELKECANKAYNCQTRNYIEDVIDIISRQ